MLARISSKVAGHHDEIQGSVLRGQENLMWNTDPIETAELKNLIGQTAQCLYSGDEYQKGRVQK